MNDKEFQRQKTRINKLVKKWKPILGLGSWYISVSFVRDPSVFAQESDLHAAHSTLMDCDAHWEYKQAHIRINSLLCSELFDEDIEAAIIHEFMHCRVAEMRDWTPDNTKHEERVVCELTEAMMSAYNEGWKDSKKEKAHGR